MAGDGRMTDAVKARLRGRWRALALLCLMAALSGCSLFAKKPVPEPPTPIPIPEPPAACVCDPKVIEKSAGIDEVMLYYSAARQKQPLTLKTEVDQLKLDFAESGTAVARMKLALLYLIPGTPVRSDGQAIALLEPLTQATGDAFNPWRGLAQILLTGIEESRRTGESATQSVTSKLKDEQKRSDELQRKLDALLEVERAMILKDQNARKK